jgi:hypothetical protein
MSETAQRDRSPAFPVLPLKEALERLVQFDDHFKRTAARPEKVGEAWGIGTPAYAARIAAALRYYGLLDYQSQSGARAIVVSDEGRKYLRAQQDSVKKEVIAAAALRPKQIAHFWETWGSDRPADSACLDNLVLKNGFSEGGARDFLKVYDATISFAGLAEADKVPQPDGDKGPDREVAEASNSSPQPSSPPLSHPQPASHRHGAKFMEGERELTTGLLSKDASFRLIVSGKIGAREIDRLIRKLELDKEFLADQEDEPTDVVGQEPRFVSDHDKRQLQQLGYDDKTISKMTPSEAQRHIRLASSN